MIYDSPVFRPLGDCYLGVEFGDEAQLALNFRVLALEELLKRQRVDGVLETIPSLRELAILFDRSRTSHRRLQDVVTALLPGIAESTTLPSRLVNIPVDYDELWEKPALSATDSKEREEAISMYAKWIDIAHEMGARSVRCDPGIINLPDPSPTVDSYKTLVSRGRAKDIRVIVENHGTASQHPEELVQILKASGAGALPDFGNFPNEETRGRGLRLMFPLAVTVCHAKLNPARFDFGRCMQMSKDANYQGVYSIEAGGQGDPYEAVQQVVDALLQNL